MRVLFQGVISLGLAGLLALPARAQSGNPGATNWPALSLPTARQRAWERNWDLLAARSGVDSATAQLLVAKEFPNPTLALSTARLGNRENSTPLGNSVWNRSYDSIAAVSQLLEIGGKRSRRQSSAQAGVNGARARFFDARRTLDQGVTKAYLAVLLAEENARVLRESAHSLQQESDIAEARFHAGDISAADLKQIQNNAAEFDLQARSAEAAAAQARIQVELLLGEPKPEGHWNPVETLTDLAAAPAPVPASAAATGAERPDVLAAEADLKRAQADLALQRALRIPDPTVSLQVEHNPPWPPAKFGRRPRRIWRSPNSLIRKPPTGCAVIRNKSVPGRRKCANRWPMPTARAALRWWPC